MKLCKKHDIEYKRHCGKCSSEAVQRRRDKIKRLAVEYKGGKCSVCGYDTCIAALQFHHLDPTKKEFGVASKGHTRSWSRVRDEIDKCILVCANCHAEIEHCIPR